MDCLCLVCFDALLIVFGWCLFVVFVAFVFCWLTPLLLLKMGLGYCLCLLLVFTLWLFRFGGDFGLVSLGWVVGCVG